MRTNSPEFTSLTMDELSRLRAIEAAARHLRSQLYVGGESYNEAKYDAEQALDVALAVPKRDVS